jgi:hypothetical protein
MESTTRIGLRRLIADRNMPPAYEHVELVPSFAINQKTKVEYADESAYVRAALGDPAHSPEEHVDLLIGVV